MSSAEGTTLFSLFLLSLLRALLKEARSPPSAKPPPFSLSLLLPLLLSPPLDRRRRSRKLRWRTSSLGPSGHPLLPPSNPPSPPLESTTRLPPIYEHPTPQIFSFLRWSSLRSSTSTAPTSRRRPRRPSFLRLRQLGGIESMGARRGRNLGGRSSWR